MKKKTWGIILLVIAGLGLLGGITNGSLASMEPVSLVGFLALPAICVYFGLKLINKD